MRWNAVCCLAKYSKEEWETTPEIIDAAVEALIDPDVIERQEAGNPSFRTEAAKALGNIGGRSKVVVPELLRWLAKEQDNGVRTEVVRALGKVGPEAGSAAKALAKVLSQDCSHGIRSEAAWALARIDPEGQEVGPALMEALKDKDGLVCVCAAEALWRISHKVDRVIPALRPCTQG